MTSIPYGETRTYGEVAAVVGDAARRARWAWRATATRSRCRAVPPHRRRGRQAGRFRRRPARKRHLLELEAKIALARDWGA